MTDFKFLNIESIQNETQVCLSSKMEKLGFIITRSVQNGTHMNYWKECVKCIRKFYNEKILIVDDNSKISVDVNEEKQFDNIQVIYSEFEGAGEILAYYYGWKLKLFKTMIILHDSMFIQEKIFYQEECNVQFLWNFDQYLYCGSRFTDFVSYLSPTCQEDIGKLYAKKDLWTGCFGVCSIIKYKFLHQIFKKYELQNILPNLKLHIERESIERLFAIICYLEELNLQNTLPYCGNILDPKFKNPWYNWSNYVKDSADQNLPKIKIIKLWSGR